MSEYPWNEKNNKFSWLSSLYNIFNTVELHFEVAVQIQLALYPRDAFLINNRNMTGNSVEK